MPKYVVKIHEVWTRPIEVEADNESDAIVKANKCREPNRPDYDDGLSYHSTLESKYLDVCYPDDHYPSNVAEALNQLDAIDRRSICYLNYDGPCKTFPIIRLADGNEYQWSPTAKAWISIGCK